MNIADQQTEPKFMDVHVTDDEIVAFLSDGRTVTVPLVWSWRLSEASEKARHNFHILGDGLGIHWPDVDEDISVAGMLGGIPARKPA